MVFRFFYKIGMKTHNSGTGYTYLDICTIIPQNLNQIGRINLSESCQPVQSRETHLEIRNMRALPN